MTKSKVDGLKYWIENIKDTKDSLIDSEAFDPSTTI